MTTPGHSSHAAFFAIRLKPGADLKKSLLEFAANNGLEAAVIVTCVGSLTQYHIRFANQDVGAMKTGHFEIVSLVGTLSSSAVHLHLAVSDEHGQTTGGHLLDGNIVFTTAEIAIAALPALRFERVADESTGFAELRILHTEKP